MHVEIFVEFGSLKQSKWKWNRFIAFLATGIALKGAIGTINQF